MSNSDSVDRDVNTLLRMLNNNTEFTQDVIRNFINDFSSPKFTSLWADNSDVSSYWILLLNGINSAAEINMAKEFLFWKEFFIRESVKIRCLQSSDQIYFPLCLKKFNLLSVPTIVLSNDSSFVEFITFSHHDLKKHLGSLNSLPTFLNTVHFHLVNNTSLSKLREMVYSNVFLKHINRMHELKKSVENGDLSSAIALLLTLATEFKDAHMINELTNISGQLKTLNSLHRQNTIQVDEYNIQLNKITHSVLSLIDFFDEYGEV